MMATKPPDVVGTSGLRQYNGAISQERNPRLRLPRGAQHYTDMGTDAILGGFLYSVKSILSQVQWTVRTPDPETRDFLKSQLFSGKEDGFDLSSWWATATASALQYGYSLGEPKYAILPDGRIGLERISARSQESIEGWDFDSEDVAIAAKQRVWWGGRVRSATIPLDKCIHLTCYPELDNPEGQSLLRSAYDDWYKLKNLQEIQAIGLERQMVGVPYVEIPPDLDVTSDLYLSIVAQATSVRMNEQACIVMPAAEISDAAGKTIKTGFGFKLVSSAGSTTYDIQTAIDGYRSGMAQSVHASFMLLGDHNSSGSFALSRTKKDVYTLAIKGIIKWSASAINRQLLGALKELNPGLDKSAILEPGPIDSPTLDELQSLLSGLVSAGVIKPDPGLEDHVRVIADLPPRMTE